MNSEYALKSEPNRKRSPDIQLHFSPALFIYPIYQISDGKNSYLLIRMKWPNRITYCPAHAPIPLKLITSEI